MSFYSKEFKHKITGEIVTQVPIMQMGDYEEVDEKPCNHCGGRMINGMCDAPLSSAD